MISALIQLKSNAFALNVAFDISWTSSGPGGEHRASSARGVKIGKLLIRIVSPRLHAKKCTQDYTELLIDLWTGANSS